MKLKIDKKLIGKTIADIKRWKLFSECVDEIIFTDGSVLLLEGSPGCVEIKLVKNKGDKNGKSD